MNKISRNKTVIVTVGLSIILCSAWAFAPIWINPCTPTHLTEDEITRFREDFGSPYITPEEQARNDQRNREEEIPCGAKDLPVREKLRAANWEGRVLNEIGYVTKPLILRFELVKVGNYGGSYYFKGYTFFYIPIYRVFAGGSGYMEIDMFPFEDNELFIADWE